MCQSHNGMALKEEFEFIAYRCAYCHYWNPARKQRPQAPRLPLPPKMNVPSSSSESSDGKLPLDCAPTYHLTVSSFSRWIQEWHREPKSCSNNERSPRKAFRQRLWESKKRCAKGEPCWKRNRKRNKISRGQRGPWLNGSEWPVWPGRSWSQKGSIIIRGQTLLCLFGCDILPGFEFNQTLSLHVYLELDEKRAVRGCANYIKRETSIIKWNARECDRFQLRSLKNL